MLNLRDFFSLNCHWFDFALVVFIVRSIVGLFKRGER